MKSNLHCSETGVQPYFPCHAACRQNETDFPSLQNIKYNLLLELFFKIIFLVTKLEHMKTCRSIRSKNALVSAWMKQVSREEKVTEE